MLATLRRLALYLWGDPPDPAWKPSKITRKYDGFDADTLRRAQLRALVRDARVRRAHGTGDRDGQLE